MFSEAKVTEIYCMADDFCKEFVLQQEKYMIEDKKTKHRNKPNRMSDAEIMVILILFHSGGFRCFKHYYKEYVCLDNIKGKLCADKGDIGQALFENLFLNGIQLVTKVKNKMKNSLMSIANALSAIAAYCFFDKKPAIELDFIRDKQLNLF